MQSVVNVLIAWQLHPVVDHFSVALVLIAVGADLAASLLPTRLWIRSMAVTLIVLGAIAVIGSNITGGWEADKVFNHVTGPAKDVLGRHEELGDILPWVIAALALWRVGIHFLGFVAGTRPIYLLVALIGVAAILYQGHEGGELVYTYGIGTAVMPSEGATPSPLPIPPPVETSPAPTLFVPSSTPTATGSPLPSAGVSPSGSLPPVAPLPSPSLVPSIVATPAGAASGGTPVNPPGGAAAPSAAASPAEPKSL